MMSFREWLNEYGFESDYEDDFYEPRDTSRHFGVPTSDIGKYIQQKYPDSPLAQFAGKNISTGLAYWSREGQKVFDRQAEKIGNKQIGRIYQTASAQRPFLVNVTVPFNVYQSLSHDDDELTRHLIQQALQTKEGKEAKQKGILDPNETGRIRKHMHSTNGIVFTVELMKKHI